MKTNSSELDKMNRRILNYFSKLLPKRKSEKKKQKMRF